MHLKKSFALIFFPWILSAQEVELPMVTTTIRRSSSAGEIFLDENRIKDFSSVQEILESAGFSFKGTNDELTFHGLWNSSIKVYVNNVPMNDPNTGKFDFSTVDAKTIKSIKIDPSSANGAVSVYITTFSADYSQKKIRASISSQNYPSSVFDSTSAEAGFSVPLIFDSGASLCIQDDFSAETKKNQFGYRSLLATHQPVFDESYSPYKKKYSGYGKNIFSNSFLADYCFADFEGASVGVATYAGYDDSGCGSSGENQKRFSFTSSVPVSLPFENLKLKFLPSYKFSALNYTEKNLSNKYDVSDFSLQFDSLYKKKFGVYAMSEFIFADEKNSAGQTENSFHRIFTSFVSPFVKFSAGNFDFDFSFPLNYFSPSEEFAFLYDLKISARMNQFDFFARATRSVTVPTFQQLYYDGAGGKGNENLLCEKAFSFYTGASFSGKFLAEVKPFLIFYRDKISWRSDKSGIWQSENFGSSVNYGADFSFSTKEIFEKIVWEFSYTFCRAILTTDGSTKGNQIMYTPVHVFSSSAKIQLPRNFLWKVKFSYASKKFTDNSNLFFVPDFYNLDTGVSWKKNCMEISAEWKNVFDFQYTFADGYPSPGTSFVFALKFSL